MKSDIEINQGYEAGLDAESLHCGDDHQTVIVQCKPRVQNYVQEGAE